MGGVSQRLRQLSQGIVLVGSPLCGQLAESLKRLPEQQTKSIPIDFRYGMTNCDTNYVPFVGGTRPRNGRKNFGMSRPCRNAS